MPASNPLGTIEDHITLRHLEVFITSVGPFRYWKHESGQSGQSWQPRSRRAGLDHWCSQVLEGSGLVWIWFLGRRGSADFRALLNLNPWTRQSSHKNIYLLSWWHRRVRKVGWLHLAFLYARWALYFPYGVKRTDSKSLYWRISQSEGKWEARHENPLKRLWNNWYSFFQAYL